VTISNCVGTSLIVHRFQWAALHLAHLLSLDRPSDIARALQSLPRGLEKTYGEIFERITSPDNSLRDIAIRTFHWLLAQDGIAYVDELLVVACQDLDSDEIKPVDIDPETVLKACQNLVVQEDPYNQFYLNYRSVSPTMALQPPPPPPGPRLHGQLSRPLFRFAHLSVQEYCEKIQWTQQVAQSFAAKTCLLFLLLQPEDQVPPRPPEFPPRPPEFSPIPPPFLRSRPSLSPSPAILRRFADSSWIYHIQRCRNPGVTGQDERLTALATRFLGFPNETSHAFDRWLARFPGRSQITGFPLWSIKRNQKLVDNTFPPFPHHLPPEYRGARFNEPLRSFDFHGQSSLVVCFFGLDNIFSPMEDTIIIPALVSDTHWHMSNTTSILSHFSTLRMLRMILEPLVKTNATRANDALWNVVYSIKNHPLGRIYAWSFQDYFSLCMRVAELVHLLHAHDCVEMCGVITTYLLYPQIPRLLPSYPDDEALQAISKVISLGANLSDPLQAALRTHRWHDVRWLLERGARPDIDALARILAYSTDRYTASLYPFPPTNVYKTLIDRGADVNAYIYSQGGVGTPIIAASILGDSTLAQLLVDAGAEVEVIPWAPVGMPPIKYVSPEEHRLQLEILTYIRLNNRERVGFGTALIEASARGHAEICRLVVKHGAGVHVHAVMEPDIGRFGTPLIAACAFNRHGICRILLGCGVDVTTISWRVSKSLGQPLITNALITAASCGGLEICRLLLCQGADVNVIIPADNLARLRSQGSALIAAASYGHKDVCQLLLDHGAKVDEIALDVKYPTALIAAASKNRWKVCQLLLDCGADVNLLIPNIPYCNALVAACRLRKLRSIEVLVARGAELNMGPSTGVYAKQLLAACMGFDARRAKVIELISSRAALPSLETNRVNEEALKITRGRLKAASSLIDIIDMKNKRDFSQVQDELQRKISALTDRQLIDFFVENDLQALLEVIYDPLLITKNLRRITQQALRRIAPRIFFLDRKRLKELFEKFPLFAADLALTYTEELGTGKLVSSKSN
jgi:hypothetical protein